MCFCLTCKNNLDLRLACRANWHTRMDQSVTLVKRSSFGFFLAVNRAHGVTHVLGKLCVSVWDFVD